MLIRRIIPYFKENISGISFSIPFSALLSGKVALFCLISISVHFISPLKAKKKLYDIRRYIYYNFSSFILLLHEFITKMEV